MTIYEWNDEENSWVEVLPEKLAEGDVLINEANFPDEPFRSYVVNNIDTSKDGILSKDEADEITKYLYKVMYSSDDEYDRIYYGTYNGRTMEICREHIKDGIITRVEKHSYDDSARLVLYEIVEDNIVINQYKYEYKDDGSVEILISEKTDNDYKTTKNVINKNGIIVYKKETCTDSSGKKITAINTYNESGTLLKSENYGDEKLEYLFEKTFYENGKLKQKREYSVVQESEKEYLSVYDELGRNILVEDKIDGITIAKQEYNYFEDGGTEYLYFRKTDAYDYYYESVKNDQETCIFESKKYSYPDEKSKLEENTYDDKGHLIKSELYYDDELRSRTEYTYKDDVLIYNKTYFHMENTTNETETTYDENGEIVNQYKKENVSGNITVDEIYFEGSNKIRKISELSEQSDGNETLKSVKTKIYYEENYSIERENIQYSVLAEYTLDSHVWFDSAGKNHKRHDVYTYPDGTDYEIYFVYDGEWVLTSDYEYFSQY